MAHVVRQQFHVQLFSTSQPRPDVVQEIRALTDLGAVALVMRECGFESVGKACVVDERKQAVLFFGVCFTGFSVRYEHRIVA